MVQARVVLVDNLDMRLSLVVLAGAAEMRGESLTFKMFLTCRGLLIGRKDPLMS